MQQLVTLGETMVSFVPQSNESLQYGAALKMCIAGAESNTAVGIQKLGGTASYITRLGEDCFGQYILRMIRAEGVDTSNIKFDPEHPTGIMFKEPLPNQQTAVHYYRQDSSASYMTPNDIPEDLIKNAEIFHFTGITPVLSKSCRDTIYSAIEAARSGKTAISFDPNIRKKLWKNRDFTALMKELASMSDYVLLGLEEASVLYGTKEISRIFSSAFSSSSLRFLAVKNGSNGAWVCDSNQTLYIPPADCCCIEPTGAGDAFNAGFLSGILNSRPLEKCGTIAAVCGAKATETPGDIESLITERELNEILNHISPVYR
ncbi:MAG TPA: sugar kinase [Candidatus Mediterraneibacter norfolkensis]|nr:sugar kinase [Candidatus Mediterraneibacter norfolkensis]